MTGDAIGPGGTSRRAFLGLGAFGALTHDVPAGAAAGNQQQCIHHDGLAGAGLAGECAQAGAEFQFGLIDDHQIAQLQMSQHVLADNSTFQDGRAPRPAPNEAWSAATDSNRSPAGAAA